MYCCNEFKRLIENVGRRGFSIAVTELGKGELCFRINLYGLTSKQGSEFSLMDKKFTNIKHITLVTGHYLNYCQYCGIKLSKLLKKYPNEYRVLFEKHKMYLNEDGWHTKGDWE